MNLETLWNSLIEFATSAGLKLLYAAAVLILGLKLTSFFSKKVLKIKHLENRDPSLMSFLGNFLSITLKILVIITAAMIIGVPAASFITILGSAGVAIGLALQGALSNLAGGIMILAFKLFRVGDYIEFSSKAGVVKSINIFYTVLMTLDNRQLTVPNSQLSGQTVINYSAESQRRADYVFDVDYSSDVDTVKTALMITAREDPRILPSPAPVVFVSAHKESSIEFTLRVWFESKNYFPIMYDIREAGKRALDAAGIKVPFNQLDVHIK